MEDAESGQQYGGQPEEAEQDAPSRETSDQ
jgi:hypothetical protein